MNTRSALIKHIGLMKLFFRIFVVFSFVVLHGNVCAMRSSMPHECTSRSTHAITYTNNAWQVQSPKLNQAMTFTDHQMSQIMSSMSPCFCNVMHWSCLVCKATFFSNAAFSLLSSRMHLSISLISLFLYFLV